ncbi:MAG: dUTPase [Candidatus Aenigmarchaeota archaeon]|nr:dUTPase [Candidatus Aenigmarchaeota archaeon]
MDGKLKKVQEGMDILLSLQRKFQEEHGFDFWKNSPEKKRDMFVRTLFAAIDELAEAGDEVNRWWKKGFKEPEALEEKKDEILEEMIDSLHFFLGALLILGVDGKDVADAYMKKNRINFERQKNKELGYV